ncbi:MAG: transketolase family protein [Bacteroidales bacterium]|nr:transketolase family protein [Bacteroidales bacterium]
MKQLECKELIATRIGFGRGLLEAGKKYKEIVVIGSDISSSVCVDFFAKEFPHRFFSLGIAEQNAITFACGLSLTGKIPFVASYATFIVMRTLDQIRVSACYNEMNIKIGGAHAGVSVGPDGATHQALEDIAALRALPNIVILSPADANQTFNAVFSVVEQTKLPSYIRFGREPVPCFTDINSKIVIGKSEVLNEGKHCTIIATGHMVWEALQAAYSLEKKGIFCNVVNMYSIKPIDKDIIIQTAQNSELVVTVEEHQIYGGLGSAVAEILSQNCPKKMLIIGMPDCFGESGKPEELLDKYKLTSHHIANKIEQVLKGNE